jgi:tetratricopeptide (TPR) repeat protein
MKKIVWGAFVAFCAINLNGCAIPEKRTVSHPPSTTSPSQSSPVYIQDTKKEQPGYLEIEDPQIIVDTQETEVESPSIQYINDRIFEYGRKLDRWKKLDSQSVNMNLKDEESVQMVSCFRSLQDVLNSYSELRNKILQSGKMDIATGISKDEIFALQKNDIIFLENSCGQLLADSQDISPDWSQRETGADLTQFETLIARHADNKEYEEIIQVWLNIPQSEIGRVNIKTKILYGNALMFLHQEEKAAEIYEQVVEQMSSPEEQVTDLVSLRKVLADLYTASGNYKLAANEYRKISNDYLKIGQLEEWSQLQLTILDRYQDGSPELNHYSDILRNFLGFIPERDGYKIFWQAQKFQDNYPYSLVTSNVELIKESVVAAADNWFNGLVAEVDRLSREKKFDQALKLLETIQTDIIGTEKQLIIKAKNEELLLAEAVDSETNKMAKMQDMQNQWNNAMLLANGERYEEAIAVFTSLLDTEYSAKADMKIKELSLEAANADRRKAADLFVRFTKTTDLESRKKLLVESRKLLKNILVKYPDTEIVPKVRGNIERVEQEMNAIDPNLVLMADGEKSPMGRDDGIDRAFNQPVPTTTRSPVIEYDMGTPIKQ